MTEYGKTGKKYILDGQEIVVDTKFILATLMSIMIALGDMVESKNIPEGLTLEQVIESMASNIYDNIKQTEPE